MSAGIISHLSNLCLVLSLTCSLSVLHSCLLCKKSCQDETMATVSYHLLLPSSACKQVLWTISHPLSPWFVPRFGQMSSCSANTFLIFDIEMDANGRKRQMHSDWKYACKNMQLYSYWSAQRSTPLGTGTYTLLCWTLFAWCSLCLM